MRTLNDIAAAIFDIDGTLLDSSGIWEHLGEDFLLRRGIAPQSGLAGILAPMTMEESCRFLRENYSLPESTGDIRAALLSIISEFYRQECQLRPGAAPLVQELSGRGVRLVLATARGQGAVGIRTGALWDSGILLRDSHLRGIRQQIQPGDIPRRSRNSWIPTAEMRRVRGFPRRSPDG